MKKTLLQKQQPAYLVLFTICLVLFSIIGISFSYGQGVNTNIYCLPPSQAVYLGQFHAVYPSGGGPVYNLNLPQHFGFNTCDPPPANPGDSTVHTFGSTVSGTISIAGSATLQMNSPAQVTVKMKNVSNPNNTSTDFDTEMLQLDISGGTLPMGTMIRESPSLPSPGHTTMTANPGGGWHVDSFFDIFTELSVDGGQTWHPSTSGAGHMVLAGSSSTIIPTLNQWGLIIFSLLMLSVVVVFVRKRRMA